MPAFKIYHDPYVTCDEDRYLSQCAFDAAGILCQHRDIIKSLDNSKFKIIFKKMIVCSSFFSCNIYMIGQA